MAAKLDRMDAPEPLKVVGKAVGSAMSTARNNMEPKMTQKMLATRCNSTPAIIQSIEQGSAIKKDVQQVLSSAEKVLNVKLQGALSTIGQPKFAKKKA